MRFSKPYAIDTLLAVARNSVTIFAGGLLSIFFLTVKAQEVNYDESKVPPYVLPNVLQSTTGKIVAHKDEWETLRLSEILETFSEQMYGRTPAEKIDVKYKILSEDKQALAGKATARQVEFIVENNGKQHSALLLLLLPNAYTKVGQVPVFISYNFNGNHSTMKDTTIRYSDNFSRIKEEGHPHWERGHQESRWDYDLLIDRGYAIATMCYHDIFPDVEGLKEYSVAALFTDYDERQSKTNNWEAIGAWAWGSSRIVDYLEGVSEIDKNSVVIVGHSRIGKAALWAGAQDERFKIVISNNSGSGGAALSKREFGERVKRVSTIKPAWFSKNFNRYHDKEAMMPFDQHMLIALMAPRPVYIASAAQDLWADPKGEYLSGYHAGPVYQLYGLKGLGEEQLPLYNKPIYNAIGYHIRTGKHDVTSVDWTFFIEFADKHFKK